MSFCLKLPKPIDKLSKDLLCTHTAPANFSYEQIWLDVSYQI